MEFGLYLCLPGELLVFQEKIIYFLEGRLIAQIILYIGGIFFYFSKDVRI